MSEILAAAKIFKTFPGSRLMPTFTYAEPLGECIHCGHSVALKNAKGEYAHVLCQQRAMGVAD